MARVANPATGGNCGRKSMYWGYRLPTGAAFLVPWHGDWDDPDYDHCRKNLGANFVWPFGSISEERAVRILIARLEGQEREAKAIAAGALYDTTLSTEKEGEDGGGKPKRLRKGRKRGEGRSRIIVAAAREERMVTWK